MLEELKEYLGEEYSPKIILTPKWVSIEKYLPSVRAKDFEVGCSVYKVKDKEKEFNMVVVDPAEFYRRAKELGVTHWYNKTIL